MSGHSKWSTIKRAKGATDAKRGQFSPSLRAKLPSQRGQVCPIPKPTAACAWPSNGPDPRTCRKDNIERAIERASGAGAGDNFDEVIYEAFLPGGIAIDHCRPDRQPQSDRR